MRRASKILIMDSGELDFSEELLCESENADTLQQKADESRPAGITPEISDYIKKMVSEVVQHRPQNEGNLDQPEAKRARLDTIDDDISSIFNACYSGSVIDTPEEETLLDSVVEPFLAGDTGPALPPKIADFIARMMTEKLSDDKLNEKVRAYKQPENCDILQPTRINQIIWDKIKPGTRSKDLKVQKAQSVLVKSMTALVVTIKDFLEGQASKRGSWTLRHLGVIGTR